MIGVYPAVTQTSDDLAPDAPATGETVDPAASAIEAYIEGATGEAAGAAFPWVAVIGFVVVLAAVVAVAIRVRQRLG